MKKLAIVGSHEKTRTLAPYEDETFDIWVFNEAAQNSWCKRWTACFQMHKPDVYQNLANVNNRGHWDWLQQDHGKRVIWMQDYDEFVPNSRHYPLEDITDFLTPVQPIDGKAFLTSTVAMAIALALYEQYDYIEVYGVDLDSNTEYASQQNGWMYWAGVARALLGQNFVIKSGEHLFNTRLYGYEGEVQIERELFQKRVERWEAEKAQAENRLFKLNDRLRNAVMDFRPDDFVTLIVETQEANQELGEIEGALETAQKCAARTDPISAQQFEREGAQAVEDGAKAQSETDKKSGIVEYIFNNWRLTQRIDARDQMRTFYGQLLASARKTGHLAGVANENKYYMGEYNARARAAGGVRTLRSAGMMA